MRKSLALAMTAAMTTGLAALVPAAANAGTSGSTPVTFTLTGGALSLSAPSSTATLTGGVLSVGGSSVSGALGSTTVTDERGTTGHTDTVTMTTTDFSDGAGHTVAAAGNATGYSGAATVTGVAVPAPTLTGVSIAGAGGAILQLTSVVGSGGASYSPTVTVAIPAGSVAGTYTGTVTQTVA